MADDKESRDPNQLPDEVLDVLRHYLEDRQTEPAEPKERSASGSNGNGSGNGESSKQEVCYMGSTRTITSVVAAMREQGDDDAADFLEDLRLTRNAAQSLLENLKALYRKKTGTHPSYLALKKQARQEP